jgi:dihydrofolate reductase
MGKIIISDNASLDEALGTEALLLGRRSYQWLAARWPSGAGALADRLNSLPKYSGPRQLPGDASC